jgi:hypothetical protein
MSITFSDLALAFELVNSASLGENQAVLDRQSGKIHVRSDLLGDMEALSGPDEPFPDDLDDARYIELPHKNELDLGASLVFDFVREFLPDDHEAVRDDFRRKGAYARFKALLARRGAIDRWHDFSNKAEEAALRAWCAENEIQLHD